MILLEEPVSIEALKSVAENTFGDMVKAVVDTNQNLLAIDAELHADLESLLLDRGSKQNSLWGINLYPDIEDEDFVEFDSMINLRPSQGNMTRSVDSPDIQQKILTIVNHWITR